jgi:hypothetical protein
MNAFFIIMDVADQDEVALIGPIESQERCFDKIYESVKQIPGWEEIQDDLDDTVPKLCGSDQSGLPITFHVVEVHDNIASAYKSIGPGYIN